MKKLLFLILFLSLTVSGWADEGDFITSWALTAANADPYGLATDGINIWVMDNMDFAIYKYDMDGTYISNWALTAANADPNGLTTDGINIWVEDWTDTAVYKYDAVASPSTNLKLINNAQLNDCKF